MRDKVHYLKTQSTYKNSKAKNTTSKTKYVIHEKAWLVIDKHTAVGEVI